MPAALGFSIDADGGATLLQERVAAESFAVALARRPVARLLEALAGAAGLLDFLHGQGLVHGDISPGNLLLSRATGPATPTPAWLVDFGFLSAAGVRAPGPTLRGTPLVLAPEIQAGAAPTAHSDIYALGCLLLAALDGHPTSALPLPPAESATGTAGAVASAPLPLPPLGRAKQLSPDHPRLRSLHQVEPLLQRLRAALSPDPARRPTAWQLQTSLHAALGKASPPTAEHFGGWLATGILPGLEKRILHALHALRRRETRVLLLHGPRGAGKTSLLRYFRLVARAAGRLTADLSLSQLLAPPGATASPHAPVLPGAPVLFLDATAPGARAAPPSAPRAGALLASIHHTLVADDRPRLIVAALPALGESLPALPESTAEFRWEIHALPALDAGATARLAAALLGQRELPGELLHALRGAAGRPGAIRDRLHALLSGGALGRTAEGALLYRPARGAAILATTAPAADSSPAAAIPLPPRSRLSIAAQLIDEGAPQAAARTLLHLLHRDDLPANTRLAALVLTLRALERAGRLRLARRIIERHAAFFGGAPHTRRAGCRLHLQLALREQNLERAATAAEALLEQLAATAALPAGAEECLELSRYHQLAGDLPAAREWARRALDSLPAGGDSATDPGDVSTASTTALRARALNLLGLIEFAADHPGAAKRQFQLAAKLRRRAGLRGPLAATLMNLAAVAQREGHPETARAHLHAALALRRAASDWGGRADLHEHLGRLEARAGADQAALLQFSRALRMRRRARDPRGTAAAAHNLGIIEARLGNPARARDLAGEAARTFAHLHDPAAAHRAQLHAALADAECGAPRRALRTLALLSRAQHKREGNHRTRIGQRTTLLRKCGNPRVPARLAAWVARHTTDAAPDHHAAALDLWGRAALAAADLSAATRARDALTQLQTGSNAPLPRLYAHLLTIRIAQLGATPDSSPTGAATTISPGALLELARAAGPALPAPTAAAAACWLTSSGRPELARTLLALPSLSAASRRPIAGLELDLARAFAAAPRTLGASAALHPRALRARADRLQHLPARVLSRILESRCPGNPTAPLHQARALLGEPPRYPLLRRALNSALAGAPSPATPATPASAPALPSATAPLPLDPLLQIGRLLSSISNPEELFQEILQLLLEEVDGERAVLTLRRGQSTEFEIAHSRNATPSVADDACRISRTILSRTYRERRLLHSSNALDDSEFSALRSVQLHQIVAFACAPLSVAGRIIGTLYIDHATTVQPFEPAALAFLEAFAAIAATAVEHARLHQQLSARAAGLERGVEQLHGLSSLVQRSRPMKRLIAHARRFAATDAPILIQGETGTGKSLLAQAIHYSGPRASAPLVVLDCGTLSPNLAASELFGHRRGAFTGATHDHPGALERAAGGTLFLDEVANLPAPVQSQLLRVLQTGQVRRLGATSSRHFDLRLICATNCDLPAAVAAGSFRRDLYYRIQTLPLELPPLRARRGDILPLTDHLLGQLAEQLKRPRPTLSSELRNHLRSAPWPGNVRELHNLLHRLMVLQPAAHWTENDLPPDFFRDTSAPPAAGSGNFTTAPERSSGTLEQQERDLLVAALEAHHWNRTAAARQLGLTLRQVRHRIQKLGIAVPPHARRRRPTQRNSPPPE